MKLTRKGKLNSSCIPRRFWVTVASTALYFPCSFEISSISSKNNKYKYNFIFIDKIIYFISLYYVFFPSRNHCDAMKFNFHIVFQSKFYSIQKRDFFVRLSLTCTPSFCLATFTYLASGIFSSTFIHRR